MMKKTCLCILGLLLLGILCVPVAAETGDQDYWSFYILDRVACGVHIITINGESYNLAYFNKVSVSNTLEQVEVKYNIRHDGADTTLAITKDYITKLREEHPGWEPGLYAWGLGYTYDVDAQGFDTNSVLGDYALKNSMTIEHLKKRGLVHHKIGGNITYLSGVPSVHYIMS